MSLAEWRPLRGLRPFWLLLALLLISLLAGEEGAGAVPAASAPPQAPGTPSPLCRFGVNAISDITPYDTGSLRMGWYVNYTASASPALPNGAEYMPIIGLKQIGTSGYALKEFPGTWQDALDDVILANPGASWLIGNEPDRRQFQDDLEPHIYALAYHDLYAFIKSVDPTARVIAGTIVQPTPIRLEYLDAVLASYHDQFNAYMPVDGWSIHNFILNEVNEEHCSPDELPEWVWQVGCWGAGVPPGQDVLYGEVVTIEQNDSMTLFTERIHRFRQWMADNGYLGLPLYLTEYGVLMPQDFGFDSNRVNAYMSATFDFMGNTTDPALGDPNDNNRLVQRWSWYSTDDTSFNGWLFDPVTQAISAMGSHYAAYTAPLAEAVDLYPSRIFADPPAPFSQGEPVTFTLKATVANAGNRTAITPAIVARFYDGNPSAGGIQIGSDQVVALRGCGDRAQVAVTWSNVPPGTHQVYVSVDPANAVAESNEANNIAQQTILVATQEIIAPRIAGP